MQISCFHDVFAVCSICASGVRKVLEEKQGFNHISWDKQECIFSFMNLPKMRIDGALQSWIQNHQTLKNTWDCIQHSLRAAMTLVVYEEAFYTLAV